MPNVNDRKILWILWPLWGIQFILVVIWPHARWTHDLEFFVLGMLVLYFYDRLVYAFKTPGYQGRHRRKDRDWL